MPSIAQPVPQKNFRESEQLRASMPQHGSEQNTSSLMLKLGSDDEK
jgi:hypothetical protein